MISLSNLHLHLQPSSTVAPREQHPPLPSNKGFRKGNASLHSFISPFIFVSWSCGRRPRPSLSQQFLQYLCISLREVQDSISLLFLVYERQLLCLYWLTVYFFFHFFFLGKRPFFQLLFHFCTVFEKISFGVLRVFKASEHSGRPMSSYLTLPSCLSVDILNELQIAYIETQSHRISLIESFQSE